MSIFWLPILLDLLHGFVNSLPKGLKTSQRWGNHEHGGCDTWLFSQCSSGFHIVPITVIDMLGLGLATTHYMCTVWKDTGFIHFTVYSFPPFVVFSVCTALFIPKTEEKPSRTSTASTVDDPCAQQLSCARHFQFVFSLMYHKGPWCLSTSAYCAKYFFVSSLWITSFDYNHELSVAKPGKQRINIENSFRTLQEYGQKVCWAMWPRVLMLAQWMLFFKPSDPFFQKGSTGATRRYSSLGWILYRLSGLVPSGMVSLVVFMAVLLPISLKEP